MFTVPSSPAEYKFVIWNQTHEFMLLLLLFYLFIYYFFTSHVEKIKNTSRKHIFILYFEKLELLLESQVYSYIYVLSVSGSMGTNLSHSIVVHFRLLYGKICIHLPNSKRDTHVSILSHDCWREYVLHPQLQIIHAGTLMWVIFGF